MVKRSVTEKPKIFFPNLDGLRFLAFALVYLQHGYWNAFGKQEAGNPVLHALQNFFFLNGATGVSVFFVLSGFLITYLILSEIDLRGRLDVGAFYIRRALRIWPLYFAVVTFALVIYPYLKARMGMGSTPTTRTLFYYVFLSNFDVLNISHFCKGSAAMASNVTWSVAVEEQFYLLWPVLFFLVAKRFQGYVFGAVLLLSVSFRALNIDHDYTLDYHSLSVCGDLAMGGLAAYWSLRSATFKNSFEKRSACGRLTAYALGLLFMVAAPPLLGYGYGNLPLRLLSTAFYAFVILDQNFSASDSFKLSKSRFMSNWGKYTYGLYLLHPVALLVLTLVPRILHRDATGFLPDFLIGTLGLGLSMLMSYVSYNVVERRFLTLKARFSHIQSASLAGAQSVLKI